MPVPGTGNAANSDLEVAGGGTGVASSEIPRLFKVISGPDYNFQTGHAELTIVLVDHGSGALDQRSGDIPHPGTICDGSTNRNRAGQCGSDCTRSICQEQLSKPGEADIRLAARVGTRGTESGQTTTAWSRLRIFRDISTERKRWRWDSFTVRTFPS